MPVIFHSLAQAYLLTFASIWLSLLSLLHHDTSLFHAELIKGSSVIGLLHLDSLLRQSGRHILVSV